MIGNRNAKNALTGLRQNDFCSYSTWRSAMVASFMGGELQVHVFKRRSDHLEVGQLEVTSQSPGREFVDGPRGGRGFDHRDPLSQRWLQGQRRRLDARRYAKADMRTSLSAGA